MNLFTPSNPWTNLYGGRHYVPILPRREGGQVTWRWPGWDLLCDRLPQSPGPWLPDTQSKPPASVWSVPNETFDSVYQVAVQEP